MNKARALPSLILALPVLGLFVAPAAARAHVTDVVITSCFDVLEGRSFGEPGPYEKCVGKIYFALDPENPRNRIIVDLDKAPRNALGEVEFSADLFVLRPKDPSRGNGVLFFDVVNRGNKLLLGRFNLARGSTDPTTEADFGDGFLMKEGYTLVAVGWEASPNTPALSLYPPTATESGRPIHGQISNWFIPLSPSQTFDITSSYCGGSGTIRGHPWRSDTPVARSTCGAPKRPPGFWSRRAIS